LSQKGYSKGENTALRTDEREKKKKKGRGKEESKVGKYGVC